MIARAPSPLNALSGTTRRNRRARASRFPITHAGSSNLLRSTGIMHAYAFAEELCNVPRDPGRAVDLDPLQLWQGRQMRHSCVSDGHALPEHQLFKRLHAAENLEASIGNLRHPRVVSS